MTYGFFIINSWMNTKGVVVKKRPWQLSGGLNISPATVGLCYSINCIFSFFVIRILL